LDDGVLQLGAGLLLHGLGLAELVGAEDLAFEQDVGKVASRLAHEIGLQAVVHTTGQRGCRWGSRGEGRRGRPAAEPPASGARGGDSLIPYFLPLRKGSGGCNGKTRRNPPAAFVV